jgi:molybdenum cofactor cytidylyltransferase
MKVVGIVLAAGSSRRLGRPKQLLPFRGTTILAVTIANALESRLDETMVILGHEAARIAPEIATLPVQIVQNDRAAEGQSTSIKAGIEALPSSVDAAVFLLGDQPTVPSSIIDRLIDDADQSDSQIIQPRYRGRPGNPVLIRRSLFPALLEIDGDQGARSLIRTHPELLRWLEVDGEMPPDVDTEDDYRRLLASEEMQDEE